MKKYILAQLDETTTDLLQTISLFNEEQFNKVPFEGSWTGGQVAEHILKAELGIPALWQGKSKPTERQPDEKVEIIKSIFLNFDTKLNAPGFIIPSEGWHEKEKLYAALQNNRAEIKRIASSIDLSVTFTDWALPQLGELTGIEWANFIIAHMIRHTRQLKNIYAKVA